MKHKILLLTFLYTTCAHGMEVPSPDIKVSLLEIIPNQSLSMLFNGTKINVIKESICRPSKPIDITFIGYHQQRMLRGYTYQLIEVGTVLPPHTIDFIYEKGTNNARQNTINNMIIAVNEPYIRTENNDFIYQVSMFANHYSCIGNTAIKRASSDLALCYNSCLKEGRMRFSFEQLCELEAAQDKCLNTTIAFPTLSTELGFPQDKAASIAIETTIDFVQNDYNRCIQEDDFHRPVQYGSINFCVEDINFELYSKRLLKYYKPTAIMLLYWAYKDKDTFFSVLPKEIIDIITRMMAFMDNSKNK